MHPALFAICRLIGLAALGFVIFKIPAMAHKPKRVFRFIVIDMLIPIYFASNFPRGWRALLGYGWHVVVIIIAGGALFVAINTFVGTRVGRRVIRDEVNAGESREAALKVSDGAVATQASVRERQRAYAILWGTHNATFLPLPLMESWAPPLILTAMYLWAIGFNIYFWAILPTKVCAIEDRDDGKKRYGIRISGPIIGLFTGLIISIFGLDSYYPSALADFLARYTRYILWLTLVLLGGVFAGIPYRIKFFSEFKYYALRYVAIPACVGIALALIPLGIGDIEAALKLTIVIQFAAPTSTNLMVVFYQHANKKEILHYAASATVLSYVIFFSAIPVFYLVFQAWFGL